MKIHKRSPRALHQITTHVVVLTSMVCSSECRVVVFLPQPQHISFQKRWTRWRQEVLQLNLFTLNHTEQPGDITAHLFNRTFQRCEHHILNSTRLPCVVLEAEIVGTMFVVIWSKHLFSLIGDHSKRLTLQITHSLTHSCTNYLP